MQGPPGVGKTRLVRELVDFIFRNDGTSRLLLTAQSNAAVDHLMDTLSSNLISKMDEILTVRCVSPDNNEKPGIYDIRSQTKNLMRNFASSSLVENANPRLRESAIGLSNEINNQSDASFGKEKRGAPSRYAIRAVEGLVVRAANVVFATTNSRELARIIHHG